MSLIFDQKAAVVATANATPVDATSAAISIAEDKVGSVECVIVAKSGTSGKVWRLGCAFKRAVGGSAALIGTVQNLMAAQGDTALSSATATLVASGGTIVPRLTGIAANITWEVTTYGTVMQ